MFGQNTLTWKQARDATRNGKTVYFHHLGKIVPVTKDTTIQDLQWNYFGVFGLYVGDLLTENIL